MGSQPRCDVAIEYPKAPNNDAARIGQQREPDAISLGETAESLLGIVANRGHPDALLFEERAGLFQLDQLGAAVLSPIGASVKHQKQTLGAGQILDRPQFAVLIRKGERRDSLTWLGPGSIAIVRRP